MPNYVMAVLDAARERKERAIIEFLDYVREIGKDGPLLQSVLLLPNDDVLRRFWAWQCARGWQSDE